MDYKDKILQGDALSVLKTLPDSLVDCVMTSPPYWGLRSYRTDPMIWDAKEGCEHEWGKELKEHHPGQVEQTKWKNAEAAGSGQTVKSGNYCNRCGAWRGELGLEPDFNLYIKHLCDIFDEVKRVLKPEGACWINIGDTYGTQGGQNRKTDKDYSNYDSIKLKNTEIGTELIKQKGYHKCLLNIPARFSTEMINRGWILRNIIIWHKPSCMPSSANDRFTSDYEFLYFFVKQGSYYFEQQFEPFKSNEKDIHKTRNKGAENYGINAYHKGLQASEGERDWYKKGGRNKRCVWSINNKGYSEAHFATYCEKLCYTPIKATCPLYICKECGKPREKIIENIDDRHWTERQKAGKKGMELKRTGQRRDTGGSFEKARVKDKGWTDCGCGDKFEPGIVLDPFAGSFTTCLAAKKLGRHYMGIELNPEYIKMGKKRLEQLYLL